MNTCDKCHAEVLVIKVNRRFATFDPAPVRIWTMQGEPQVGHVKHRCPPVAAETELALGGEGEGPHD